METNNNKAMREALIETQSAIARCMDILNKIPDTCGYGGLLDDVADELCALREWYLKDSIAEPVRNCDVLSADQCKKIFEREMGIYLPQEATDRDRDIARCTAYGVIDALFSPFTGWKGDGDGSK